MASDQGTEEAPPAQGTPDEESIRTIVREEIEEFVTGLTELGDAGGDDDPDGGGGDDDANATAPASLREIEAAAERAVTKAMKPLRDDLAKRNGNKPKAANPKPKEDPPVDPPRRRSLGEVLWGSPEK